MLISKFFPAALMGLVGVWGLCGQNLPVPSLELPPEPKLASYVITGNGRRLLLNYTDVQVTYDPSTRKLTSNKPGWWIVNFPLERIRGFEGPVEGLSQILFDTPQTFVRNWYLKTPGTPVEEPAEPTGPAPIDLTPNPSLIVDQRHPSARDTNPGNGDAPLATIGEAVRRAVPGSVIHVRHGIYRERIKIEAPGTPELPIRLEGVRSEDGMPVIEGNDPFPAEAWTATEWPGVFRSNFLNEAEGPVTAGGLSLIERSQPAELKPGEFTVNRASREFIRPALDGNIRPAEGESRNGAVWRRVRTDNTGLLNLAEIDDGNSANALYWASTWVWVEPASGRPFDPAKPAAVPGNLAVDGTFRAFRATGVSHAQQSNKYRVWVNGAALPATVYSTDERFELLDPHPLRISGLADEWFNFPFREGWNHLVFQFDTTVRPQEIALRFRFPDQLRGARVSAAPPQRLDAHNGAVPSSWITEYLLLGPFQANPDRGVYVRLPNDFNPNREAMEGAARGSELLQITGSHVHVRGFAVRGGYQYQQQAQVSLNGAGSLLEGSTMTASEVVGAICSADKDRTSPAIVFRNNWIVSAGNVGFGCGGRSELLTSENLNTSHPGRSPVLFEHNVILNSNWGGYPVGWSAGASKNVHLTGMIFRYNSISGSSAPGIWIDWENYGNRIEGNLIRNVFKFGIGVEASPGPNLIANNLLIGLRPDPGFPTSLIASWDSSNTWAVHNTVNGLWNAGKGWVAPERAQGISLGAGGMREILFGPQKTPRQAYANNIVLGFEQAILPQSSDDSRANYSDSGAGGIVLGRIPEFRSLGLQDYRLLPSSALARAAIRTAVTNQVGHDFLGLMRHRAFPDAVGAFRAEPTITSTRDTVMEIEYEDGAQRLVNSSAPSASDADNATNRRRIMPRTLPGQKAPNFIRAIGAKP